MKCNNKRKYDIFINVPDQPTKVLVKCEYHCITNLGRNYCSVCPNEEPIKHAVNSATNSSKE